MPSTKNLTTTSRIDHPINIFYVEQFLRRAMPRLVHAQFGKKKAMPAHAGDTIKWRRYTNPTAQTTPLIEGEDPTPVLMDKTDLSATVREYGAWQKISSWLDLTGKNSDIAEITKWMADQFELTIDTLCREIMAGTGTSATCSTGSPTSTQLNKTDIDTAVRTLLSNEATMLRGMIGAGQGQGTSPIRDSFIGIAHVDLMHQIERVSGFKHVSNYASGGGLYKGEWGNTGNVRWVLTNQGKTSGSNYYCFILAEDCIGNVKIPEGEDLLKTLTPEQVGSPLGRFQTYGWLTNFVSRILNDNWLYLLSCTAS